MGRAAIITGNANATAMDEISKIHAESEELQEVTKQIASYGGLVEQCGINETDIEQFEGGANQLHDLSHLLAIGYHRLENEIFSCSAMNPIYTEFVHEGTFRL
jgi:hypothetical protein